MEYSIYRRHQNSSDSFQTTGLVLRSLGIGLVLGAYLILKDYGLSLSHVSFFSTWSLFFWIGVLCFVLGCLLWNARSYTQIDPVARRVVQTSIIFGSRRHRTLPLDGRGSFVPRSFTVDDEDGSHTTYETIYDHPRGRMTLYEAEDRVDARGYARELRAQFPHRLSHEDRPSDLRSGS